MSDMQISVYDYIADELGIDVACETVGSTLAFEYILTALYSLVEDKKGYGTFFREVLAVAKKYDSQVYAIAACEAHRNIKSTRDSIDEWRTRKAQSSILKVRN